MKENFCYSFSNERLLRRISLTPYHYFRIITESFYSKADLEQWLIDEISREDYRKLMEKLWEPLVEKDLSFVLKSSQDDRVVGVSLNFDLWDEPEVELDSKLTTVFEFLEYLEKPIREKKLPKGKGQIIHNFMMATHSDLVPAENVIVMGEMEEYCLRVARNKEYGGIFTTNTSPLTQVIPYSRSIIHTCEATNLSTLPHLTRRFDKNSRHFHNFMYFLFASRRAFSFSE